MFIGDSVNDASMAEGTDTVLRVFINDPRLDELGASTEMRGRALQLFDGVIESGSLQPVTELVRKITG